MPQVMPRRLYIRSTIQRIEDAQHLPLGHRELHYSSRRGAYFATTTLRTLTGYSLRCTEEDNLASTELFMFTKIDLENALLDSARLGYILASCPRLRTLLVEVGDACVGTGEVDFASLGDALRQHGKTLKHLHLEVIPNEICASPFGDLNILSMLQSLVVPFVALFGQEDESKAGELDWLVDTLPNSLQLFGGTDIENESECAELESVLGKFVIFDEHKALSTLWARRIGQAYSGLTSSAWEDIGVQRSRYGKVWSVLKRR
ncbi:hypothetical protein LTR78_007064 [Recurvomyces mirabilis]|uniref:Uncharacterized protein n=1 Tax=Recurvomyces mirabilis TaxID=574656 RepID=A0AAE0WJP0_9PEZI|nr:hypothetical protein LTR78_007064 [Recurvomyces mirabilis]KAK5150964.1 hypothetical protein LTS14_009768 [Recurvomyces mirabilis]